MAQHPVRFYKMKMGGRSCVFRVRIWPIKYPNIEIVTRDRASVYSAAIDEVYSKTIHVADRLNLLMNLSDAINTYFKSVPPIINALITNKTAKLMETKKKSS